MGAGHFGAVYLAVGDPPVRGRTSGQRRLVAIKKLRDASDERAVQQLVQEFALLEQIKHRCIVRVFEYLEDENAVVMEYIHGVTLRTVLDQLLAAHEQVFTEAAVEIGCEVADALYQAWTTPGDNGDPLRLVHRDLKPENVMLTPSGEVKVLDWGLARADNAAVRAERTGGLVGSLLYMAPEQAKMLEVDHRSDLYGLGLILFELLMGQSAFDLPSGSGDAAVEQVRFSVQSADHDAGVRELEARLPAVGPLVARALRARPEDRYQNGQDFLVELRRQLYRDRGSYREEFCEFFFGSIHDIGEPPQVDGQKGRARRLSGRSRNPSLEERVRRSMARDDQGSAAAGGVVGGVRGGRVSAGRSSASAGPRGANANERATGQGGGEMTGGNGKGPRRPPVGGGASRSGFEKPDGGAMKRKLRNIGQRSPDETGMLEMVPLSTDGDDVEAAADPSATAFFAIPAPKAERARAVGGVTGGGGPPPPPGVGASAPPPPGGMPPRGAGAPPPPAARPPIGQPPPAAMRGSGGPPASAPVGISGPVAPYGGGPSSSTPFQVGAPVGGAAPGSGEQRVKSQVVWVVLFGALVIIGVAALLAVYLMKDSGSAGADGMAGAGAGGERKVQLGDSRARQKSDPSLGEEAGASDTGIPRPKPKKKKKRRSASSSRKVGSGSSSSTGASSGASRARAPSGPATLSVRLPGIQASSVEVTCPSGVRKRATVSGEAANVPSVPQEDCTLYLKGGAPGKYGPVKGGQSLSCTMSGVTLRCR